MYSKRFAKLSACIIFLALMLALFTSTAFAAMSGSGNTGGVVTGSGTFKVVSSGSSGISKGQMKVTVSQSSTGCITGFRILRADGSEIYTGGMINGSETCYLPAFLPAATYTVDYHISGSAYISAEFLK